MTTKGHIMTATPTITGPISEGTLRSEDLLPAFLNTLAALRPTDDLTNDRIAVADALLRISEDRDHWLASEVIIDLDDKINAALPYGWYFGANEGDGACFGIWAFPAL
jgi:hypothetical protein